MSVPPPDDARPSRGVRPADVAAGFVALAALAFVVAPLWRDVTTWATSVDARASWFLLEVDRVTLALHHELPLWNPYGCAGMPQLASPQSSTLSPLTALVVLFGTPFGYRPPAIDSGYVRLALKGGWAAVKATTSSAGLSLK